MGLQWPGGKISTSGHAGSTFETRMYQRRADLMVRSQLRYLPVPRSKHDWISAAVAW
ncbi:hypothetical protein AVEN_139349-1, partial [Araneus ventricosus]